MLRPRLHKSSIIVGTLVALLLVLIEVPGQAVGGVFGTNTSKVFQHGWPWVHLRRETVLASPTVVTAPDGTQVVFQYSLVVGPINPRYDLPRWGIPWLSPENWRFWETDRTDVPPRRVFDRTALICNMAVAIAVVTGAIGAWEVWRRRRTSLFAFRFDLVEMCVAIAILSGALGWLLQLERGFQREERLVERELNRDLAHGFEDYWVATDETCVAPKWMRLLIGERFYPSFFWRASAVNIQSQSGDSTDLICTEIAQLANVTKIAVDAHPRRPFRFSALRNLERIKTLEIWRPTTLDNQALNELSQLKRLNTLVVEDLDDIAPHAIARLKAALPDCQIIHHHDDW